MLAITIKVNQYSDEFRLQKDSGNQLDASDNIHHLRKYDEENTKILQLSKGKIVQFIISQAKVMFLTTKQSKKGTLTSNQPHGPLASSKLHIYNVLAMP